MAKRRTVETAAAAPIGLAAMLAAMAPVPGSTAAKPDTRAKAPDMLGTARTATADGRMSVEARARFDETRGEYDTLPDGTPLLTYVNVIPGDGAPLTDRGRAFRAVYVPLPLLPLICNREILDAAERSVAATVANWRRIGPAARKGAVR